MGWATTVLEGFAGLGRGLRLAVAAALGILLGMAGYLMVIAEGASYLSDDPEACINCHVMVPEFATWRSSSHGRVAHCNDCHVPHDNPVKKYAFKASDGLRHSALFTLRLESQVIVPIEASAEVIQANCVRCHVAVVNDIAAMSDLGERRCVTCHREVPHGRVHSLSSTPNAAVPPLGTVLPDWLRRPRSAAGATPPFAREKE